MTATFGRTFFSAWKKQLRETINARDTIIILGVAGLLVFFLKEGFLEEIRDQRDGLIAAQHEFVEQTALFNLRLETWKLGRDARERSAEKKPADKELETALPILTDAQALLRKRVEINDDLSLATIRTEEREKKFENARNQLVDVFTFKPGEHDTAQEKVSQVQRNIDLVIRHIAEASKRGEESLQQSRKNSNSESEFYDILTKFIFRTLLILTCLSAVARIVGAKESSTTSE